MLVWGEVASTSTDSALEGSSAFSASVMKSDIVIINFSQETTFTSHLHTGVRDLPAAGDTESQGQGPLQKPDSNSPAGEYQPLPSSSCSTTLNLEPSIWRSVYTPGLGLEIRASLRLGSVGIVTRSRFPLCPPGSLLVSEAKSGSPTPRGRTKSSGPRYFQWCLG